MKGIKKADLFSLINGLFSSAAQVIFLRELFAVFSGNELYLGLSLSVWMLAGAIGNLISSKFTENKTSRLAFLSIFTFLCGITLIRAVPLLSLSGEIISAMLMLPVLFVCIAPCSVFTGAVFGSLVSFNNGKIIYRFDNAGNLAGLILISIAVYFNIDHLYIIIPATLVMLPVLQRKWILLTVTAICLVSFILINPMAVRWKYSSDVSSVIYGREGEIAIDKNNKTAFLNNRVYKSADFPARTEQAVHLPLSLRNAKKVLLVNNNGHASEIRKYEKTELTCIENEPLIADSGCSCQQPEKIQHKKYFDAVILGNGVPENIGSSRLFTIEFYRIIKETMSDSGVFSFTLGLNTSFLNAHEKKLKDLLVSTLLHAFKHVQIFRGEGWTFVASDSPFDLSYQCTVQNSYYTDYILPELSLEKIEELNEIQKSGRINSIMKPTVLRYSLEMFLEKFKVPFLAIIAFSFLLVAVIFPVFFRSASQLSIGTTGFCTGLYTMAIMMLYQSVYGTLYSKISVLMVALSSGFVIGSFVKNVKISDLLIGSYAVLTLVYLAICRHPYEITYFLFNIGMGILAGAQMVNSKENAWSRLNASDLAGGVGGVGIASMVIVPVWGISGILIIIGFVKLMVEIAVRKGRGEWLKG